MAALYPLGWRKSFLFAAVLVAMGAFVLWLMGREIICTCGTVRLWHGDINSSENSQHLFDWYSLTHVTHGLLFYFGLWLVCRLLRRPFDPATMMLLAVSIETTWEIVENTEFIIDRYRTATLSLDYRGDSIVNSIGDILSMMSGFLAASVLPALMSVALVLASEAALAVIIRDNLLLNVLMLIYPVEAIRVWQKA